MILSTLWTLGLFAVPKAEAGTITVTDEIQVSSRVQDAHYVLVDSDNRIRQIDSNTFNDVTPRFYKIQEGRRVPVDTTESLLSEYRVLIPDGSSRPGTLYMRSNDLEPANKRKSTFRHFTFLIASRL